MFVRLPLQRRIMLLVSGGLGITMLVVAALGLGVMAQSTDRVLEERLVMARIQAANLDDHLRSTLGWLEELASSRAWRDENRFAAQRPELIADFLLLDSTGAIQVPGRRLGERINDAAARSALRGVPAVSGLLRLPPDGAPVAVLWVPARDPAGTVTGALGGVVDLRGNALGHLVMPLALGQTGHAMVVDGAGTILAGNESHELFTRGDHPDFFAELVITKQATVGRTPKLEQGKTTDQHVMAFAPLQVANWGVGFGQAEWEVFLHERQLRARIALLGGILVVAGLLFAWWDAGGITRPLRRLTSSAKRIAEGDLESPIPSEPGHEVGLLAGALETMRTGLRQMRADLRAYAETIERQAQRTRALYEVSRTMLADDNLADILASIVSAGRSLLAADVSAVCLRESTRGLVPVAFDGPKRAFANLDGATACTPLVQDTVGPPIAPCAFIRPEFRAMHLTTGLRAGDRLVGYMCIGCAHPRTFDESDAGLLASLASLAAVAIESAQLRDQVQRIAVLEDRERIGRDLHDSIIQSLYGISLQLEHAQHLIASRPARAAARVETATDAVTQAIKDIRSYVLDLHGPAAEGSLREALERVVREFRMNTLLPVEFTAGSDLPPLTPEQRLHYQLLLREALANVARHAYARRVRVDAEHRDGTLRLVVTDDGRGFDTQAASSGEGLGLRTMRDRARLLGGACEIRSRRGGGTTVEVRVPIAATGADR